MKFLKSLVLLFISVSLISCGSDDDSGPSFELSSETIAASYEMNGLEGSETVTVSLNSSGAEVEEIITASTGSLFTSPIITLSANGTFSITGSYALETIETVDGATNESGGSIVILDDSGTYSVDADNDSIVFNSVNEQLLEGIYDIESFKEDSMVIVQSSTNTDNSESTTSTTTTREFTYTFERQ